MVEVAVDDQSDGNNQILPISLELWQNKADVRRTEELKESFMEVEAVLREIRELNSTGMLSRSSGHRRAVVFYLDRDRESLVFLTWWIHAWKLTGLNTESFDLIVFSHPQAVQSLASECQEIRADFDPSFLGAGRCLYRELVPFSERNIKYYNHLNSLECLYNKETSTFLTGYKTLLRADLDTIPTPALVNFWPDDLVAYRDAGTTFHLENIEGAIRRAAAAAGIKHQHWHNIDSSVMGPSLRVIMVAKLTTVVSRFTRAFMFGPGTMCRCAQCLDLVEECSWGTGIWGGTLLMYSQEIAMNFLWSQREYNLSNSQVRTHWRSRVETLLHVTSNIHLYRYPGCRVVSSYLALTKISLSSRH